MIVTYKPNGVEDFDSFSWQYSGGDYQMKVLDIFWCFRGNQFYFFP